MKRRGPKAAKSTALSIFFEQMEEASITTANTLEFDRDILLNFVDQRSDSPVFYGIKNDPDCRRIERYRAGNSPDKAFLTEIRKCENKAKFAAWISNFSTENTFLIMLAEKYDSSGKATQANFGSILAEALDRIILSMIVPTMPIEIYKTSGEDAKSLGYKKRFGHALIKECDTVCETCGEDLIAEDGSTCFRVIPIDEDPAKSNDESNFVPVCPNCYARLMSIGEDKRKAELFPAKELWSNSYELKIIATDNKLDEKVTDLLDTIDKTGIADAKQMITDGDIKYDPVAIEDKLGDEPRFCRLVKFLASSDFDVIRDCLKRASSMPGRSRFSERIRHQIRAAYCDLADASRGSKEAIFLAMTTSVQRRTKKSWVLCAAFISYYVQGCDFFDAIAK
jgi:hypothetical protein